MLGIWPAGTGVCEGEPMVGECLKSDWDDPSSMKIPVTEGRGG